MEIISIDQFEVGLSPALRDRMLLDILSEMGDRKHAEHSPSSLKNKSVCGSFRQDQTGEMTAANRGTIGHKGCELNNPHIAGDDEFLFEAIGKCLNYVESIRTMYGQTGSGPKPFIFREKVVATPAPSVEETVPQMVIDSDTTGYLDFGDNSTSLTKEIEDINAELAMATPKKTTKRAAVVLTPAVKPAFVPDDGDVAYF